MGTQKHNKKIKIEKGMTELSSAKVIPKNSLIEKWPIAAYKYRYTSGPFLLPQNSGSLDWGLLNNSNTQQKARVTVFKCPVGSVKTPVAPGPLVVTVDPGKCTHNANEYSEGFFYEVQVECNSKLVFPNVSIWPGNFGVAIPGTSINSGMFMRVMH
ncbi:hypothetical protein [Neptunomonas qingdaonensis]|uniref:Uncharacterized protein n=1 Tax=Neptunomonas qingdaonensis TaxID=1045558 RepID=A0A1I2UXT3_9GAMM|nr:hypothetical protein [Neptunomonas qingdaonensis]SFG79716.1 hypothetical protein SAMN05216175_1146 [Neptunomonas qingdaonensis]